MKQEARMKNNQSPIYKRQVRISLTVFIFGLFFANTQPVHIKWG
jgi:hypothetical protein